MRSAVIFIDMQNCYFEAPELAARRGPMVTACNRIIRAAGGAGVPVIVVHTEHERDKSTWTLNMLDDDQGFAFRDSRQAQALSELDVAGLPRVCKTRDSAFRGTDLLRRLRNFGTDTLVLAGVSTHNCVAHTAADAFAENLRVIWAVDAIASTNEGYAGAAVGMLCDEYRQTALSNDELFAVLRNEASG